MAINPHLYLWRSVLLHGLKDASKGDEAWLFSDDFRQVCSLAQVNPDAVLQCYTPSHFMRLPKVA